VEAFASVANYAMGKKEKTLMRLYLKNSSIYVKAA